MENMKIVNRDNQNVLMVVDEALGQYGSDILSVDLEDGMLSVNIYTERYSDTYMSAVARFDKCNIGELENELDKRNVGHCW